MPLLHTLSYTNAVARRLSASEDKVHFFRGSSLIRKRYDKTGQQTDADRTKEGIQTGLLPAEVNDYCRAEAAKMGLQRQKRSNAARLQSNRVHVLSKRSKAKIREKIFALYGSCPSSCFTFLTLTFIADLEDKLGQKILNKFLTELRRIYKDEPFLYLWVAERQPGTGRIHFHFILNRRFPIAAINSLWVMQQYNAGLVGQNKNGEAIALHEVQKRHFEGSMQEIFNPADIRQINNVDALAGYLTEYITKNDAEMNCSTWHCCRGVSRLYTKASISKAVFEETINPDLNFSVDEKTGEVFEAKSIEVKTRDGYPVALISYILNKGYFRRYLRQMDALNECVISDYIQKTAKTQTFVTSMGTWAELEHNEKHESQLLTINLQ